MATQTNVLLNMDRATLRAWVNKADGWTIWDADRLRQAGFPEAFLGDAITTYQSIEGDPKQTIFTDDGPVDQITGVYALSFLFLVCRDLGVDPKANAIGRGFQARQVQQSLNDWFNAQEESSGLA